MRILGAMQHNGRFVSVQTGILVSNVSQWLLRIAQIHLTPATQVLRPDDIASDSPFVDTI